MILTGQFSAILGAYFGIIIDVIFLGGTPQHINYTKSRLKALGRLGIVLLCWFVPIYVIQTLSNNHFMGPNSYAFEFLVRCSIPYFIFTFLLFSFVKIIFFKLDLVN